MGQYSQQSPADLESDLIVGHFNLRNEYKYPAQRKACCGPNGASGLLVHISADTILKFMTRHHLGCGARDDDWVGVSMVGGRCLATYLVLEAQLNNDWKTSTARRLTRYFPEYYVLVLSYSTVSKNGTLTQTLCSMRGWCWHFWPFHWKTRGGWCNRQCGGSLVWNMATLVWDRQRRWATERSVFRSCPLSTSMSGAGQMEISRDHPPRSLMPSPNFVPS